MPSLNPTHARSAPMQPLAPLPRPEHVGFDPAFGVGVPARQEVEFADGHRVWLHRVHVSGCPDLFMRAVGSADGPRVDLRRLVPELADDLPVASTRDVPGIVHYSLRGRYKSLQEFHTALQALATKQSLHA
jgi:hypothetical protein